MGCLAEMSGFISFSGPLVFIPVKLELVTCLCSEAVYGQNCCVPIFQAEEFEFLQNSARTEFLQSVNTVNTLLFLYVVKKDHSI